MTEREIFAQALLCPNEKLRAAWLDEACSADGTMRARIEQLLSLHERSHTLLDRQPAELLAALGEHTADRDTDADGESVVKQLASFLAPATRPGALGRLGHYELLQVLGHGGFGIVLKARDDSLERIVAIKVLAPHMAATSPPRKRFLREARLAAAVRHEHIVQTYAVEEQPLPFLVMEFIEGQTLQQKLDAVGPLEASEVVYLGQQIALGLAAAHDKGLIHRDVKPANILLEAGVESRVKLTDFGLARASDDASMSRSGILAGSPMYMAPEQAGGKALDHRADLFSLGSVLYTMATGRPPFRAPNTFAVLKRVVEDSPRPIREVIADVPAGLCAVIDRLLEKQPEKRFATARETAQALSVCLTAPVPVAPSPARPANRRLVRAAMALLLLSAAVLWIASWLASPQDADPGVLAKPTVPPLADYVVTSTLDDDRPGTLRWAITQANIHQGEDTIAFDPTVFSVPKTITLTKGPLVLIDTAQTTIIGPAAGLTISGNDKTQVFVIGASSDRPEHPAQARIADLTIAHGRTSENLTLGGGVYCRGGSILTLSGCTLRDNSAIEHNTGGGAVFNDDSTLIAINCTFANNQGYEGSGIKNFAGNLKVFNCTFAGNSSTGGAGLGIWVGGFNRARAEIYNSLFADGAGRPEIQLTDALELVGDYNLSNNDTSPPGEHSKHNVNPLLGPLGGYGGPTEVFPLLTGSPATDAGDNERIPTGVRIDQRGKPRIANGKVDIGAYEAQ